MQIVVHFRKTSVLQYDEVPNGAIIRNTIAEMEGLPMNCFHMQVDGKYFCDSESFPLSSSMVVRVALKVNGGKGGFGAMLKSMAKKSGSKKTTDFGACRDLSGRRLRHVNDDIILKKWQEAKDRGDEFDTSEDTQTGIDLWYLSAPSWADGIKKSRKRYMKDRTKTRMCLDWLNARKDGTDPPRGAATWWGCPRGPRCEFAHGEEELRGEGKKRYEEMKKQDFKEAEKKKKDTYMAALEFNQSIADMSSLVAEGLARDKRAREPKCSDERESSRASSIMTDEFRNKTESTTNSIDELDIIPSPSPQQEISIRDNRNPSKVTDALASPRWLHAIPSESSSLTIHPGGVVECTKGFGTVRVDGEFCWKNATEKSLQYNEISSAEMTRLYYEVELVTGGLLQIGWIDNEFLSSPAYSPNENDRNDEAGAGENGVGDDKHSWAYDGFRQFCWNEECREYPESKKGKRKGSHEGSGIWKARDVIGCFLSFDKEGNSIALSFHLNGCDLGVAFDQKCISLESAVKNFLLGVGNLYPALSLEERQSAAINIGQRPFKYDNFPKVLPFISLLGDSDSYQFIDENENEMGIKKLTDAEPTPNPSVHNFDEKKGDTFEIIDLESKETPIETAKDLESKGLAHLKIELERRGLKAGGTLEERASRLFAVKGLQDSDIPKKLLAKKNRE